MAEATVQTPMADTASTAQKLNWLRAAVLGANDGIVSVAAVVVGVVGATSNLHTLILAGGASVIGGAISMALGEYVSVASSSDSQRATIEDEERLLREEPDDELEELTSIYRGKGLSEETAQRVAVELTEHDALGAHLDVEHHLSEEAVLSPMHAAVASFFAFVVGSMLPFLIAVLVPSPAKLPVTFIAVLVALALTGYFGARLGDAPPMRAMFRTVIGGALALVATFLIGSLFGTTGIG